MFFSCTNISIKLKRFLLILENEPDVLIENLGNGYTSLLLVNIDGNPYEKPGEVVHWFVCNVPDGGNVKDGTEIVPYLQPLPFKGTGYHRLVVLLLRHKDVIDASTYKPNRFTINFSTSEASTYTKTQSTSSDQLADSYAADYYYKISCS